MTYGTPNYKEVNPTAFNMSTFPFLFGVMFGDIGHGILLFLFGAYLVLKKDTLLKGAGEAMFLLLKVRYLFLLMGFFAIYCGFIYNDMMSMPLNLFGSCWEDVETTSSVTVEGESSQTYTDVVLKEDCVYPFGLDPKWYVSHNELNYFNSLKMKMAVILGVA